MPLSNFSDDQEVNMTSSHAAMTSDLPATTALALSANVLSVRDVILQALYVIIGTVGTLGNLLVIVVIASYTKLRSEASVVVMYSSSRVFGATLPH